MKSRHALALLILLLLPRPAAAEGDWRQRLYSPTMIAKLGEFYFIVDCWHHRVIWSKTLQPEIGRWKTLDDTLAGPHSIASDGTLYVVDDTDHNRLCVYKPEAEGFRRVQQVEGLGKRPHRVRYDAASAAFYVLCAESQQISRLVREGDRLALRSTKQLDFLRDDYTRSMTIHDASMYFVSGPGEITKAGYRDDRFRLLESYRVPEELNGLAGMNDLFRTADGWWYMTATPKRIARAKTLDRLMRGDYEKVEQPLGLRGTPYYLSEIDGRYYVPQINEHSGIVSFVHRDGRIADVRVFCDFGPPLPADAKRRECKL